MTNFYLKFFRIHIARHQKRYKTRSRSKNFLYKFLKIGNKLFKTQVEEEEPVIIKSGINAKALDLHSKTNDNFSDQPESPSDTFSFEREPRFTRTAGKNFFTMK